MGTATATTVSTVVSDYTMESGGMRKSKRIMPRNREEDAGKGNEPVVWYAFFSEKAGREYYYEPKSKTVTWVMPDDHHPYPNPNHRGSSMDETAEDQPRLIPAPKVTRKVSWGTAKSEDCLLQSSDEKGIFLPDRSISDTTVDKTFGKRLLIGAACIVVLGGAFCLGRLWDDSGIDIGATDVVDMPQSFADEKQHVAETFVESVADTLNREEKLQEEIFNDAPVVSVLPTNFEVAEAEEVMVMAEAAQQQEDAEEEAAQEEAQEEIQEESSLSPAPAKCKIPFAYIVCGECRRRSVPLFDAEAFSLLMMQ